MPDHQQQHAMKAGREVPGQQRHTAYPEHDTPSTKESHGANGPEEAIAVTREYELAFRAAYEQLHHLVECYGPLNREKNVNVYGGVDMVDHQFKTLPLNPLGVMVVASAKIRQWQGVVGQAYLKRIGGSIRSHLCCLELTRNSG